MIDATVLPVPPHPIPHDTSKEKDERIRVVSTGHSTRDGHNITISNLTRDEQDKLEGASHGHHWVTVSAQGRLRAIPTYKPLPDPIEDPLMQPFWRLPVSGVETQLRVISMDPLPSYSSPSIIIHSLCGYGYKPEEYVSNAKNLGRWGFICMRSQRDPSGRYMELWYLPFLLAAKNELKDAISKANKEKGDDLCDKKYHLEAALDFLGKNVSFGALDASFQRMAMSID